MANIGKPWKEDEIKFVLENRKSMTIREVAEYLGRTYGSVCNKIYRLKSTINFKHSDESKTIMWALMSMLQRCYNQNNPRYKNYGARGIKVCNEWKNDKNTFIEWSLNNGWERGLTIDRIDNNSDYCPENCRWITNDEQQNNKSNNVLLTAFGETKSLMKWKNDYRCNVSYHTLRKRVRDNKMSGEDILTRTKNTFISAFNETKTMSEWSRDPRCSVSKKVLGYRLKYLSNKMSYEEIVTTPARQRDTQ